jgi:hypothetical protein
MTIGIDAVDRLAAKVAAGLAATITSTFRRTSSAARSPNRSVFPSASRHSMVRFSPSTYPTSRRLCRKSSGVPTPPEHRLGISSSPAAPRRRAARREGPAPRRAGLRSWGNIIGDTGARGKRGPFGGDRGHRGTELVSGRSLPPHALEGILWPMICPGCGQGERQDRKTVLARSRG